MYLLSDYEIDGFCVILIDENKDLTFYTFVFNYYAINCSVGV